LAGAKGVASVNQRFEMISELIAEVELIAVVMVLLLLVWEKTPIPQGKGDLSRCGIKKLRKQANA
jgi:hypothetical protein